MTCRYSSADWRDVLYNSVRATEGGVSDAAQFLTNRRGRSIHPESLRIRLRHVNGESISLEMVELLTEWMQEKARQDALDWLDALNAQYGRQVSVLQDRSDGTACIQARTLSLTRQIGEIAGAVAQAQADQIVTPREADEIAGACRELMRETATLMSAALDASKGIR